MNAAFEKRLVVVWAILSAITLASYLVPKADSHAAPGPNLALTVAVILVSLLKVRLIIMEFMEARHAPLLLRRLTDVWLLVTAIALLVPYLAGLPS